MNTPNPRPDERDSKRAFRWIAIVAAILILGAIVFNVFWMKRPPANAPESTRSAPAATQDSPAPPKPPGS